MRVAYITAGAAGMYCGSCLHDNALAAAMIRAGHDVSLIPIYTPIRTDEHDVSIGNVFYGAINVYMEQKSSLFRHTPWLVDRMFNSRGLLEWTASHQISIDAKDLGEMTVSVLEGEDGRQRKELGKLVAWLRNELKPDVVNLPNSMLLGLTRRIKDELGVPVICALQGEDIFLDELAPVHRERVSSLLRSKARDVDGFIVHSQYYVDYMSGVLEVDPARMHVVPLGLNLDGHGGVPVRDEGRPFTIGYLARVCPEKGLHILAEAFRELGRRVGPSNVRLRIAGYVGGRDEDYRRGILDQLAAWGLIESVDYLGEVDREHKIDFLRSLDVLSVPTTYHEPKGIYVLEAMANRVPVVQPRHGAFPELLEATGGGLLVEPNDPAALADGLERLMGEPDLRLQLGQAGHDAVHSRYRDDLTAENVLKVYHHYVENRADR